MNMDWMPRVFMRRRTTKISLICNWKESTCISTKPPQTDTSFRAPSSSTWSLELWTLSKLDLMDIFSSLRITSLVSENVAVSAKILVQRLKHEICAIFLGSLAQS